MCQIEGKVATYERNGEFVATSKSLAVATPAPPLHHLQTATPLPSLLHYVDNDLLRRRAEYDRPPNGQAICSACGKHEFAATIKSTYLPLTCGCWMHYRCFIGNVAYQKPHLRRHPKDCCPACGTQLFIWEGIVALTLAERTNVLMPDVKFTPHEAYADANTGMYVVSDKTQYESDCALISALIQSHFLALFEPAAPESRFADGSPDLTACYYAVLADLDYYGCPRSKWLAFSREKKQDGEVSVGFLLFGMLVALKMRGFLNVYHAAVVETEGWAEFENIREGVQRRILADVRGEGWSWGA
ncbi:uncharacterized protein CC84DRAFT_1237447 [Paraphaeosphaeria sporulosa]|uniref:Uncharacterized protein n=1 Tax=Paraphaeosphaeria sporulosa TaxID=1460663 RepID=A0A177CST2_9PLEO|nr:uncharacterized protein CC84DRAFT_1237447 [Paraphaeosphaeria sporulosa]OAG10593.1 hypothetical protein CC84DRAFT_1237447 [Paraphaeosphaeria sporulosa]